MIDFKKWAQSINGPPTELVRWTLHNLKRDQSLGALKHINVDMIEHVRANIEPGDVQRLKIKLNWTHTHV